MEELFFIVGEEEGGIRLDKYLAVKLGSDYSRSYVRQLIDGSFVEMDIKKVKASYLVQPNDHITVTFPPQQAQDLEPEDIPLNIIHEDNSIVVINKPAGMVVHPGAGNRSSTMVNALLFHCNNLADTGNELRPGIVHRLDKDTSGVIVVAKNDKALRSISKQFQNRTTKKKYIAFVKGSVEMDNGIIEKPLARSESNRKKMAVNEEKGKYAKTVYHVVRRYKDFTVVDLFPATGRTHQIRVHMKHIGYPIIGDTLYGGGTSFSRQALHAERITFTHPETRKTVEYVAELAEDMMALLKNTSSEGR